MHISPAKMMKLVPLGKHTMCALRNPPTFALPVYTVNALSSNGLRMMFGGCLAVSPQTRLLVLVDTGANRSFVSQQLIEKHDLKLTDNPVWRS